MQDLNKVNQMFDKMFLGSNSVSKPKNQSATHKELGGISMDNTALNGAGMASTDLSRAKVANGSFFDSGRISSRL